MSSNVPVNGVVRALAKPVEPSEEVTAEQASDAPRAARLFMRLLRDIATLRRRWSPLRVDHEDRVVDATGTTLIRFPHELGTSSVRYWAVRWSGATAPCLRVDASSDARTLVLTSTVAGTVTLRIEEAG